MHEDKSLAIWLKQHMIKLMPSGIRHDGSAGTLNNLSNRNSKIYIIIMQINYIYTIIIQVFKTSKIFPCYAIAVIRSNLVKSIGIDTNTKSSSKI
uniref:hypothetical protein n=1 Tax=Pannonibacter phragmitetus TaxID=121719 RepID=UPI000B96C5FB|nr:hypothetical protein [Pannonibacter phragmitetus]